MKKLVLFLLATCTLALISFVGADKAYEIGDTIEDFTLANVDGSDVSLSSYAGEKGAIVIFTCNTCPYAVLYEDRIIDLHNTYAEQGYPVLAINPNDPEIKSGDSFDEMKIRAEEKSFPFAYVFDAKQEVFPKFDAQKTPHAYLLKKNEGGDLVLRYVGAIDNNAQDAESVTVNYIGSAIEAVDAGNDPEPLTTKAIGCSIKYKKA